jgi:hypothetical protein
MTAAKQRKAQRLVHLAAGLVVIASTYAPVAGQLDDALRFLVLPLLVVTGIAMWQAPRIRRVAKTISRAPKRPVRDVGHESREAINAAR